MKRPFNLACIKVFVSVPEASVSDVLAQLEEEYKDYPMFDKDGVEEALMTAMENGILSESRYDEDENGNVRIFYKATEEQRKLINRYIKD